MDDEFDLIGNKFLLIKLLKQNLNHRWLFQEQSSFRAILIHRKYVQRMRKVQVKTFHVFSLSYFPAKPMIVAHKNLTINWSSGAPPRWPPTITTSSRKATGATAARIACKEPFKYYITLLVESTKRNFSLKNIYCYNIWNNIWKTPARSPSCTLIWCRSVS